MEPTTVPNYDCKPASKTEVCGLCFDPSFAQWLIVYRARRERVLAGPGAKPYSKYDTSGASQIIRLTMQNRPTFLQLMARVYSSTV